MLITIAASFVIFLRPFYYYVSLRIYIGVTYQHQPHCGLNKYTFVMSATSKTNQGDNRTDFIFYSFLYSYAPVAVYSLVNSVVLIVNGN